MTAPRRLAVILATTIVAAACGGGGSSSSPTPGATQAPPPAPRAAVSMDKASYPVFPDADKGADPAVPAEQGGKGFTGQGWETSSDFDLIGDPRAVKGGALRDFALSFPGTLRMAGPEWNTSVNYAINSLVYEQLLTLHPTTLAYMPMLATHWQIGADKLTYRFQIDPNARFSDGTPVTSEDVVKTWEFLTDKTLQDLYFYTEYNKLEKPVAESKYIVRMKAKNLLWQNFLTAASLRVFPAHILKTLDGAAYLRDYNFKLLPGTGPYSLADADIKKGTSITLRRRKDYWAANYRANIGQYNFDEYKSIVVRDENLAFEMFKKGELDYYAPGAAQRWVEEMNFDHVQRGLVVKRKVYNSYPRPISFLAFNTRRKPWDDVRVREAFALLLNRAQLIDQLFFKEYLPLNSYYPGTPAENPNDPTNPYDPEKALKLLADAGWKDHDAQGRLTKDGQPLQIEVLYADKGQERWFTVYQNDLRKAGITLNLRLVNPETSFKMWMQRQFDMVLGAWGAGSVFPNPRPEYHSEGADVLNTNNISGFKDKRIDDIIDKYDVEFDVNKRNALLRDLDLLLTSQHHYILRWYSPASARFAFWNRFGMPEGTFSAVGDLEGTLAPGMPQLWWIDPDKNQKVEQALKDSTMKLPVPPLDDRHWEEYMKAHK